MYIDRFLVGFVLGIIVGIVAIVGIALIAATKDKGGDEDGQDCE